ncbi:hypothetical protein FE810_03760 [Thalassotalea litorea]|uniref:Uncharacterized protein n=1 Tax=Thalassotalea litorea TaxID=2020715 RepID=A0A5R9IM70_9GAMM|nr:hypothetical protein [Thalassotalea litorea]TLU66640.1 hypothetical protein FE810_03760 [Thalassotalea litorea]
MDFDKIRIGMICGSRKGSGTVTWVDGATQMVYLTDLQDNRSFEVGLEELLDDPQIHNHDDYYY